MFFLLVHSLCFNPRTREGCDSLVEIEEEATGVSIHAPARGATVFNAVTDYMRRVSIHAPARGATEDDTNICANHQFQSTHPRGVRLKSLAQKDKEERVSIHAPARGATLTTLST